MEPCRYTNRVRSLARCSRRLLRRLQGPDGPVPQPVEHEREQSAGHRGAGLLVAPALGDAPVAGLEPRTAVTLGYRLDGGPTHELGALLGHPAPDDLGVGLEVPGCEPAPTSTAGPGPGSGSRRRSRPR